MSPRLIHALCAAALPGMALATSQTVTVEAVDARGRAVTEAQCDVTNRVGTWRVVTPQPAQITPTRDWLTVRCTHASGLAGSATSIDAANPAPRNAAGSPREPAGVPLTAKVRVVLREAAAGAQVSPAPVPAAVPQPTLAASAPPSAAAKPVMEPAAQPTAQPTLPAASPAQTSSAPRADAPRPRADVFDVRAVPHLGEAGRTAYTHFLQYPMPRAFAISPSGGWGFGVRGSDPAKLALDNCAQRGGPCQLYAVDREVVWPAQP